MSDHADIDRLPLEIDGVQIRETICEIFRNSANGKPDDITKAGCLELAHRSNEQGHGHEVWNVWRRAFPVLTVVSGVAHHDQQEISEVRIHIERSARNNADFFGCDFRNENIQFSYFEFGDFANFQNAQWGGDAKFRSALWGDGANFRGARWGSSADFTVARWGDGASFSDAHWDYGAIFTGAQWGSEAFFIDSRWGDVACFKGAQLGESADFQGSHWGKYADFRGQTWGQLRPLFNDDAAFEYAQKWAAARDLKPDAFGSIDFRNAIFQEVDFSDRKFNGKTNFDTTFKVVPKFHACELHQDTSFEGAKFPVATGDNEAARAYRTLKLAFSKGQATREEQQFFRLEMEEERISHWLNFRRALKSFKPAIAIQEIWVWFLHKLYELPSKYGLSVVRPTLLLVVSWLLFAQIYGSYLDTGASCLSSLTTCELKTDWLGFSWHQALPLTGLNKPDEVSIKKIPLILLTFHKAISLAALFLIGLALRNLFKLK